MDVEIRALEEDEYERFFTVTATAFGERLSDDIARRERTIMTGGRAFGAVEGDQIVAGLASVPLRLSVPSGGEVACAGVTSVGTLPTHRRRGLARALLVRQLEDARDHEEPLAYLWASEAAVYQRFGYGTGALACAFDIDRHRTAFVREPEIRGRTRLVDKEEGLKLFPDPYDRVRRDRPGMPSRSPEWWRYGIEHAEEHTKDRKMFYVVHETDEGVGGYASYWIDEHWSHRGGPGHVLEVEEMVAATDDAYVALWRYCFEVDLVQRVRGWKRPVDEPLLLMLLEPRALGLNVRDGTWVRVVDVPAALEGRTYPAEGKVVLRIHDPVASWTDGTFELDAGPGGAACRPTDAEPDLEMEMNALSSAYLGGIRFHTLLRAGRVAERTEGATARADAMFATAAAPWCPWIF